MKELILREMPGIHLCTSSETLPEIREYERFCTTAVNAYLMPKVKDYINHLAETLSLIHILFQPDTEQNLLPLADGEPHAWAE